MPRPRKWRKVCRLPKNNTFGPIDKVEDMSETIIMSVDEYETIRLIDYEQMSQEECGNIMNVGRTTAQRIYNNAKSKLADSLINGKPLMIQGGEYQLCDESNDGCNRGRCRRRRGHNRAED